MYSNNSTSMQQAWASIEERIALAILFFVLAIVGFSAHFMVTRTIMQYRRTTFANPFYTMVLALGIIDCVYLMETGVYGNVCIIVGSNAWVHAEVDRTMGGLETVCFFSMSYLMVGICLNRYVAVCHYDLYRRRFTNVVAWLIIVGCICIAVLLESFMEACSNGVTFALYCWQLVHGNLSCASLAMTIDAVFANASAVLLVVIYAIILLRYRGIRGNLKATVADSNKLATKKQELSLMLQFASISLIKLFYDMSFWFIFQVLPPKHASAVINVLGLLNSSISPFLYLTFGSEIRRKLWNKVHVQQLFTMVYSTPHRTPR